MKKLLLTLCVSIALCGSLFAQARYTTHWEDFDAYAHSFNVGLNAYIQIDGEFVTSANYEQMEVAAFDAAGECRGTGFLIDETDLGDLYPGIQMQVYYDNADEPLTFELWDHAQNKGYTICNPYNLTTNEPYQIVTGEWHLETWDGENEVVLAFTSDVPAGYTLEIDRYENEQGKDHYYLIASPVGAIAANMVEGLRTPAFDFYSFNQAAVLEWINLRDEETFELQPGVGYLYANSTGTDLTFNGTPTTEQTVSVPLTYVEALEGLDFPDWNLVGNPFEVDATLDQPFYSMVEGAFVPKDANAILPAMNGAFVVGSADVTAVTFSRQAGDKAPMLALNLTEAGKLVDRAIVSFGQGRQLPKIQLFSSSKVYIPQDGNDYALVRSEGIGEMPVSFKAESNGSYSLTLSSENTDFAYLHLIDNLTGADQDLLANPSYSFSANTTDYASRFRLVFATANDEDSFAFFSNGSLFVNNEGNATLQVVDVTGRIIKCENINGSANINIDAAPGVYMVRLINGDNMKVQKVVK